MLNLIGWGRTTSDAFTLSAYVVFDTDDMQYSVLSTESPWLPQPGDVFTDPVGLTDTVVSVETADPTTFKGINNFFGWTDGFATIVRKTSSVPGNRANFRGIARAFDNPATKSTDLILNSGNIIEDLYNVVGDFYAPPGFPYASTIEVVPQTDLILIRNAWYFAPQGLKVLINTAPSNRFVIEDDGPSDIDENKIFTNSGADITVAPGESVALIRDTQDANNTFWRAGRNSPLVP